MNGRDLPLGLFLTSVLALMACESDPYGDILNGKACTAGECAPGYQCIEGACVTTWLAIGDDSPPRGTGGDGGSPDSGGSPGAGGSDCVGNGDCPLSLPQGAVCSATTECSSGYCVDSVCCESVCAGGCFACIAQQTNGPDGSCLPVTAGQAPGGECGADESCDGSGACVCTGCNQPPGAICATDARCASGKCADQDGICCDSDCNGTCLSCKGTETGGSDGECAPILFALDPENECQGNDKCNGEGGCVDCNGNDCDD